MRWRRSVSCLTWHSRSTSWPQHDPVTTTLRPSTTYVIYWAENLHWHWLAVSYWLECITATRCCTALHPAASRYCSERRTMQPGSSSRLHDVVMPGHYCETCTGCPFNTESSTRSLCWLSRAAAAPQHPTYLSRHIKARVSERTVRSSTTPLLDKPFTRTVWNSLPETIIRCDSLSVFKSKLKTYFSTRLLTNTHDWPAASASEATALRCYTNLMIIIIVCANCSHRSLTLFSLY